MLLLSTMEVCCLVRMTFSLFTSWLYNRERDKTLCKIGADMSRKGASLLDERPTLAYNFIGDTRSRHDQKLKSMILMTNGPWLSSRIPSRVGRSHMVTVDAQVHMDDIVICWHPGQTCFAAQAYFHYTHIKRQGLQRASNWISKHHHFFIHFVTAKLSTEYPCAFLLERHS